MLVSREASEYQTSAAILDLKELQRRLMKTQSIQQFGVSLKSRGRVNAERRFVLEVRQSATRAYRTVDPVVILAIVTEIEFLNGRSPIIAPLIGWDIYAHNMR
jgi:hypothetical protein